MKMNMLPEGAKCPLRGINLDTVTIDGALKKATLTDEDGGLLHISVRWETLELATPAPPEMKKVHRLSGIVLGIAVQEDFDSEYLARNRRDALIAGTRNDDDCVLTIAPEEVVAE